ncbi:MAG: beta-propeller fold lactonase family protein [Hydrotalea flava]|uniref:lactonase family protein n=1 Tax=Hydrotalea TaxID=1004300 RepID=UPI000941DB94|nr:MULTISPECIES: lactonase family protein [Hydrotalea]NIM36637.1 beta-propeller fold lactonase family protein [Hydrotalea flava]NIM39497.1 beta-propeller fold lactonase family protein [Hydrotalea flava]NIN04686.1 beta-propeller fold lactonase family protein [Hydrotalea flava]NIN16358.1 beta-propeller fold lactonase family protein [Hydrotalea flava]NIO95423.1 beta-propeller fold lactonase family protein [Hydrotalea flava]
MRLLLALCCSVFSLLGISQPHEYYMMVGSYTNHIEVYKFNTNIGSANLVSTFTGTSNPSYLTVSDNGKFVYAVNENHKEIPGAVSAFSFNKKNGTLQLLNTTPSGGDDPCYIDVDATHTWAAVANYSSGSLSMLKINADGSLQPLAQNIEHHGYSVNVTRQEQAHVHCTIFSPGNKYLFVDDLGTDKVYQYHFNPTNETAPLSETDTALFDVPDGYGPRHLTFSPNKKFAYLITELAGKVICFNYDSNTGRLQAIQTIASCTVGDPNERGSADIHITPDGKYLYTSNRGKANDITIYRIAANGTLTELGHQSTLGVHPRNFVIDPTGKFLLVANRDTNNIVVFTIYKSTGMLVPTGVQIKSEKPVCLKMFPVQ